MVKEFPPDQDLGDFGKILRPALVPWRPPSRPSHAAMAQVELLLQGEDPYAAMATAQEEAMGLTHIASGHQKNPLWVALLLF